MPSPVVRVENVWFRYCRSCPWVLRGAELAIGEGEYLAVMGGNGCGKTTLLKLINGLLKPVRGRVLVGDVDTRRARTSALAGVVGLVFQNPDHQLFASTVAEELAAGPRALGLPPSVVEERVEWALKFFGLRHLRDRNPLTLSMGEKRRVSIASVAVLDPRVMLLDEPTVGLDREQREQLWSLIRGLLREGRSVVIATHDVEFVASTKPRVLVLAHGRIAADGPAEELLVNEDVLRLGRLTMPQVPRFFRAAQEVLGVELRSRAPLSPEEGAEVLRRWLGSPGSTW